LLWYGRDKRAIKYRQLFFDKVPGQEGAQQFNWVQFADGTRRQLAPEESPETLPPGARVFQSYPLLTDA